MSTGSRVLISAAAAIFAFVAMDDMLGINAMSTVAAVVVLFATWSLTYRDNVPESGMPREHPGVTPHHGDRR